MKIKNLNIKKKLITTLLTGTIAVSSLSGYVIKHPELLPNKAGNGNIPFYVTEDMYNGQEKYIFENQIQNVFEYNEDWDLVVYNKTIGFVAHQDIPEMPHDETATITAAGGTGTITANIGLRFRLGPSTNYTYVKALPKNTKVEVLGITSNNWYVIKYKNEIGYVSGEYVKYNPSAAKDLPKPLEKEETTTKDPNAIYATTNANVNFRKGPSLNDYVYYTIPRGSTVEILDASSSWYKVKYQDTIGYTYGRFINYTAPIKEEIITTTSPQPTNPIPTLPKVVYANSEITLQEEASIESKLLYTINAWEICEVVGEVKDWYLVKCAGYTGYVLKSCTTSLSDVFVVVDISEQKLTLYKDNEIILETDVTTGKKDTHDTPYGAYSIKYKKSDTYLTGADYRCHVDYWMPFYNGYGLHDATWRNSFGGTLYEKNGSHGCVNIPHDEAETIYNNVSKGTKVLIHK